MMISGIFFIWVLEDYAKENHGVSVSLCTPNKIK
jgi:hypothetical protein